ncbi:hypothetical protein ACVXHB_00980 [Escherichia coli]
MRGESVEIIILATISTTQENK